MEIFFLCIVALFGVVFITYFGWKLIKYIAYNLSHAVAKGIYDARNGAVEKKKEMASTSAMIMQKSKTRKYYPKQKKSG